MNRSLQLTTCALGVLLASMGLRPDDTPHATAYIDDMVALVSDLVARGVAYEISEGVYLNVEQVPGYSGLGW